jgi:hypothetical protein
MSLFRHGEFTGNSGKLLQFKVECDELDEGDIDCSARIIASWYKGWEFGEVVGVPPSDPTKGGIDNGGRLAEAVRKYVICNGNVTWCPNLILDDVFTTGGSLERTWRARYPNRYSSVFGAVIFAHGPCPSWVRPIWIRT